MTPDTELLRTFLKKGDEAAFAEIVRRHADLVYSVSLRVTRNPALAQDATQTAFTILARKAQSLVGYDTLVGWLHMTARHAAINVVRGEERRRAREHEASIMQNETTNPALNWEEIGPLLDEAVESLPEADRKAILLRFFQNRNHQEVGDVLGLGEDSARKRGERALEKLRSYFAHRGVTVSSALLATSLVENSVQAAPAGMANNIARVSVAGASVAGGGVFLSILFMSTKTKLVAAAVILALVALTLTLTWPTADKQPVPASSIPTAVNAPKPVMPVQSPVLAHGDASALTPPLPVKQPTPTEVAAPILDFTVGPKTDLKTAIATGQHYLETKEVVSFLKTLMPPTALTSEAKGATVEDFAKQVSQSPSAAKKFSSMLEALSALQDKTPSLNDDGTRATYQLDPPVAGHKVVIFNKLGDFWYLNGM